MVFWFYVLRKLKESFLDDTFQTKTLKKECDIDFEIINDQILNFLEISAESTDWFC